MDPLCSAQPSGYSTALKTMTPCLVTTARYQRITRYLQRIYTVCLTRQPLVARYWNGLACRTRNVLILIIGVKPLSTSSLTCWLRRSTLTHCGQRFSDEGCQFSYSSIFQ